VDYGISPMKKKLNNGRHDFRVKKLFYLLFPYYFDYFSNFFKRCAFIKTGTVNLKNAIAGSEKDEKR
jgi:hypothetical protein